MRDPKIVNTIKYREIFPLMQTLLDVHARFNKLYSRFSERNTTRASITAGE